MKNKELVYLAKTPVGNITAHNLTSKEGYTVFKFKKVLKDLFIKFCKDEADLISECGIGDVRSFNERLLELQKKDALTEEERDELKGLLAKSSEFRRLDEELLSEEVFFDGIAPLNYEAWFILQNENMALEMNGKMVDVLSGETERILEGVLWQAPVD